MKIRANRIAWGGVFLSLIFASTVMAAESSLESWIRTQTGHSVDSLYRAISPPDGARGAVMASPSRSEPDYYAHWIRDASLVMSEVWAYRRVNQREATLTLKDFALLSRKNQMTDNRSGEAEGMGLGEPKFLIDGRPYDAPWGRPQNDGPALRVLALLGLADDLMMTGEEDFVKRVLYRLELPARTVIKADLEFVAHHWMDPSFDLWEEVMGDHFYTRMTQWRALEEGASFAWKMGDDQAAEYYRAQAVLIRRSLDQFWSTASGYLVATKNQVAGAGDKYSNLDIAIVLGVLHAGKRGFPFNVDDDRVIATAFELEKSFDAQYLINGTRANDENRFMAPGIGRYPEDRYDGYGTNSKGNPWFLATHAMAEFYLRLHGEIRAQGHLRMTELSRPFFEALVKGEPSYTTVQKALLERSDAFIRRAKFHTAEGGRQSEQFNRNNGMMQGARDLTWSYASFLSLSRNRDVHYE